MAKTSRTKGEKPGPTQSVGGYGATSLPPNPSDAILAGRPLPLVDAEYSTLRRPFTCPTRNPMHYNDGPGTDEVVTSRRTQPPLSTLLGHKDHEDLAEHLFGEDSNKYSGGPDDGVTSNGVPIYGT